MGKLTEQSLHEVFRTAIEEERRAQELYRRAAQLAGEDSRLHAMFLRLEKDERRHEETLLHDYAYFKETMRSEKLIRPKKNGCQSSVSISLSTLRSTTEF